MKRIIQGIRGRSIKRIGVKRILFFVQGVWWKKKSETKVHNLFDEEEKPLNHLKKKVEDQDF